MEKYSFTTNWRERLSVLKGRKTPPDIKGRCCAPPPVCNWSIHIEQPSDVISLLHSPSHSSFFFFLHLLHSAFEVYVVTWWTDLCMVMDGSGWLRTEQALGKTLSVCLVLLWLTDLITSHCHCAAQTSLHTISEPVCTTKFRSTSEPKGNPLLIWQYQSPQTTLKWIRVIIIIPYEQEVRWNNYYLLIKVISLTQIVKMCSACAAQGFSNWCNIIQTQQ